MDEVWVFIAVSCITAVSTQTPEHNIYCDPGFSCDGNRHTLCQYDSDPRSSSSCEGITEIKLSDNDKLWILGAHNGMRNLMAKGEVPRAPVGWPQAANMFQIEWDPVLARCARKWAAQCKPGKDKCRSSRQFHFREVQQNQYGPEAARSRPNWKNVVAKWFQQMLVADKFSVGSYKPKSGTNEFFLMMWAEVNSIGCGAYEYHRKSNECKTWKNRKCKEFRRHFGIKFVCNYAPATMQRGEPAWEIGKPCSKCPTFLDPTTLLPVHSNCSKKSTYKYLCAVSGHHPENEKPVLLPLDAPQKSHVGFTFLLAMELLVHACN